MLFMWPSGTIAATVERPRRIAQSCSHLHSSAACLGAAVPFVPARPDAVYFCRNMSIRQLLKANKRLLKTKQYSTLLVKLPHSWIWHRCTSSEEPTQEAPPSDGAGESHCRDRAWTPFPQVTVHAAHSFQYDHSPSLASVEYKSSDILIISNDFRNEDVKYFIAYY